MNKTAFTSVTLVEPISFVEPLFNTVPSLQSHLWNIYVKLCLTLITNANVYYCEGAVEDSVRFQNVILLTISFIPVLLEDVSFDVLSCVLT